MTKDVKDIFNIESVADLPEVCQKQIKHKKNHAHPDKQKLLELFDMKNPLTINEIIAGLYRVYGIERSRTWVYNKLNGLFTMIKRQKNGYWKKITDEA